MLKRTESITILKTNMRRDDWLLLMNYIFLILGKEIDSSKTGLKNNIK